MTACACGQVAPPAGYGGILIDSELGVVQRNGRRARLGPREFELFICLFAKRGRPAGIEQLHRVLYAHRPQGEDITDSAIHVCIRRLRLKLRPLPLHVDSHWGRGYTLRDPESCALPVA